MKKTQFLFSYRYKKIGWYIFIPALVLGILYIAISSFTNFEISFSLNDIRVWFGMETLKKGDILDPNIFNANLLETLIPLILIIGGTFVGFSKNKNEDEFIEKIRFESLALAVYVNNIVLILCLLFVWGFDFLYVMMYNMFTLLLFFIICFYFRLYFINRKALRDEE